MKSNRQKIRSVSAKMTIVLKAGFILSIAVAILAIAAILILLFSGEDTKSSFLSAFHVTANNGVVLSIAPQSLLCMFCFMLVDTLLISCTLYFVYAIFDEMKKGSTPFSHQNTVRIKYIAILAIVLGIVGSCSDALADYYTIGELTWRIDAVGIIRGMIIYCISLIFHYGCDLQRESDETL